MLPFQDIELLQRATAAEPKAFAVLARSELCAARRWGAALTRRFANHPACGTLGPQFPWSGSRQWALGCVSYGVALALVAAAGPAQAVASPVVPVDARSEAESVATEQASGSYGAHSAESNRSSDTSQVPRGAAEATADAAASEPVQSSEGFLVFARSGLIDFEAGRCKAALALFDRALAYPARRHDRATLVSNMGACLSALGRFDDAEQRFIESANLDPSAAGMALLQAGFAALRAGRIEDAKRHLAVVRSAGSEGAASLDAAVDEREAALAVEARLARCTELADRGATELARGSYVQAQLTLESALELAYDMAPAARANLGHGAALAAYRRGDFARARGHIERAISDRPDDPELRILHARILLRLGDVPGASRAARRAAEQGAIPGGLGDVESEREAISPLPTSGWSGYLTALGGWDSNPVQSGLGAEGGLSSDAGGSGSATASTSGSVALTGPSGEHGAQRLEYTVDSIGLLAARVNDLSTQAHGLGTRWYRELGERWLLRLSGSGALRLVGLESPEMMSYGLSLGAALALDPELDLSTELEARATRTEGLGEYEYLGGSRFEGRIAERWLVGPVELKAGVGGRYVGLGTIVLGISSEQFPACTSQGCDGAAYAIPLTYAGPRIDLDVSLDVGGSLTLRVRTEGEYRSYREASRLAGESQSRKLRRDWRWRFDAESELGLGKSDHFALLVRYSWLGASSNVDYDAADPEHYLDYGSRSFFQDLVEAGVTARF